MKTNAIRAGGLGAALFLVSCSFVRVRPCTSGGQPAHDTPVASIGVQKCTQVTDPVSGKTVNEGKYYEWYENEVLAVEGEYKAGKKSGRWIEYDSDGNRSSDRYFLDGKEVPKR